MYDPIVVALIVKVEVPDPLMVVVPAETVTPVGLEMLSATVDPNPFTRFRLMLEVPCPPVFRDRLDGLAVRLKSWKLNVADAAWFKFPLVPEILSV